ncbi:MAG: peptide deformylase [Sphaerochaetaceae bacterium]|nr:peptide deformylase [Sphaerochaetaceae bacterium]
MLDISKLGDDILRVKCSEVKTFDRSLELLTEAMFETMEEAEGIGLAAPQVGVDKRFFVIGLPSDGFRKVFVNPQIIETSVEEGPYEEGCLSLPGLSHEVIRPLEVTVFAQDVHGKAFTLKAEGLLARAIQHEYDHLDGKLYIDRLSPDEKKHMIELFKRRKKNERKGKSRKRV